MELKPFEHISIRTTLEDEEQVSVLTKNKEESGLICGQCGSTRFTVEAYIKAKIEILNESRILIITGVEHEVAYVNRVVECTICKAKKPIPVKIS
jgi:rRNA processing protein Krr1/Pno1